MNNKTLKRDLCARLMDGVKAEILDYKKDYVGNEIDTIVGISQWSKCGKLWSVDTKGGSKPSFERIKPYFFPASALTKEIQLANYNNGEPFVPVEEIAQEWRKINGGIINKAGDLIQVNEMGVLNLPFWIIELLQKWHINYRLSPDQFIEVTEENNPYN